MTADLVALATAAGVEVIPPAHFAALQGGDFRDDPTTDYGRVVRKLPLAVLRPRDQNELGVCLGLLRDLGLPCQLRGVGHSSGGQSLIEGGAVLDLRHLDRVVDDDPGAETITVEGGARWLDVVRHLAHQGRRPRSVTANLRSSVAGTLAVGGFGDASHLCGLQVSHVERLRLVTPDGRPRDLGRDDELCRFALAGRGQLGVIAEATLQTVRRPTTMMARLMYWTSLVDFVRDSAVIAALGLYDFVRARLIFPPHDGETGVLAHVGRSAFWPIVDEAGAELIHPARKWALQLLDLQTILSHDLSARWSLACPAMEIVLPLPEGLAAWPELARMIVRAGLPGLHPQAPSVMVVPVDPRLPLAPTPATRDPASCLMIALRPEVPIAGVAPLLPALRQLGRRALELGGRIYLMSIELDDDRFLERQFGAALPRLRALKAELDPRGLMNPGLLTPAAAPPRPPAPTPPPAR